MRKRIFDGLALWAASVVCVLFEECLRFEENFTLLYADMRNGFADNPEFCNRLLLLLGAASVVVFAMLGILWAANLHRVISVSYIALAAVFIYLSGMLISLNEPDIRRVTARFPWGEEQLILHAGGGVDEYNYTNSMEALESSYARNAATIELDFILTADDGLVCWHSWTMPVNDSVTAGEPLTFEAFMEQKIFGRYEPLSIEKVIAFMKEHPDLHIVTDTKSRDEETVKKQFNIIVEAAKKQQAEEVLDRMIVQIYSHQMYGYVDEIYHFDRYILTLYRYKSYSWDTIAKHCRFCKQKGIKTLTMWDYWATPDIIKITQSYGMDVYVHTVNEIEQMKELQNDGVKGVYTDYIFPSMLE